MITVACVLRQGGKVGYDATWVDKLQRAVKRHLTIPHRFVCLSDCEVNCERIPLGPLGSGYWSKLQLFQQGLFDTPVLYLDLDTLICNHFSIFLSYRNITEWNTINFLYIIWRK